MRKGLIGGLFLVLLLVPLSTLWASSGEEDLRALVHKLLREVRELKKENAELRSELEKLKAQRAPAPAEALVTAPSQKKHSFFSKGGYGSSPSGIDFYGFFKLDAVWQDNSAVGNVYVLWALPEDGDNKFTLNYRHSRFGFDFWKYYSGFKVFGKIEMDFYHAYSDWNDLHSALRARRVYAGVEKGTWQLVAGLDWQTVSQLYPHLSNFPAGTFMGNFAFRMTQVRLSKWFNLGDSKLRVQVAAEQPYSFDDKTAGIFDDDPANDAGFPGIEARVAYETKIDGKPALFALWGHFSQEEYDIKTGEEDADSYSLGLEVKVPVPLPFAHKAFLLGEIWTGRNVDRYYTAGVNQGVKFDYGNGVYDTNGKNGVKNAIAVEEIDATGGWIELEIFWTPKLVTHFGWGVDNPDDDDLDGVASARLQQQMYYANFLYRITKDIAVGGEYMYIDCDYRESYAEDGELNRFMASFYYFF